MGEPADQPTSKAVTVTLGRREFSLPEAEAFCRRYANGFFWIAGLSLINMIMIASDSNYEMILGLGLPQALQGAARAEDDPDWLMIAYVLGCAAIALFVFLGWRARRIERWPFILGMSLYALDSLIYLTVRLWVPFGFHLFWLLFLSVGLRAVGPIHAARRRAAAPDGSDAQPRPLPAFLRGGTAPPNFLGDPARRQDMRPDAQAKQAGEVTRS